MGIEVREEDPADTASVRRVNELAFGRPDEADLVERLRDAGRQTLSFVVIDRGDVAGHILFSPVTIPGVTRKVSIVALGPMAILPDRQRLGFGSRLVKAGLEACRKLGHHGVVVLGHAGYYPRFGFVPASRFGISCTYDAPDEAFMAVELTPGAFDGISGTVHYCPEFG